MGAFDLWSGIGTTAATPTKALLTLTRLVAAAIVVPTITRRLRSPAARSECLTLPTHDIHIRDQAHRLRPMRIASGDACGYAMRPIKAVSSHPTQVTLTQFNQCQPC
ncbi:hypothetical protein AB0J72_54740 [Dactylosporangium sp. NPDC049742]|uniref:hypothetical protein n=1 Tax=Dactylosporangium sp. NPDC049742 TaxID=3154737 RepID=UPI00343E3EF4